jgi:NAD(P)-dependent dehydrogenase (short-subunit alcohol dehydrogenase family)
MEENEMELELNGKTAIVTGGSRGIGKAVARELALEGVDVAIVARGREALESAAEEIQDETGRKIIPIQADTGVDDSVKQMVEKALSSLGRPDILVNCAARPLGRGTEPGVEEIAEDAFWADMNVKVMGYLRCIREVTPHMKKNQWGRIINISGHAARKAGSTIGSMRNVSVVAMTKNLADELGPFGINVSVVHPGLTWTERMPELIAERAEAGQISTDEMERQLAQGNAVRKIIDAREVAYVVVFLASPKSIAITGDVIAAGGGVGNNIYY